MELDEIKKFEEYEKLLIEFKVIPITKTTSTFLEIYNSSSNFENVCSNILKFYLNPNNNHGFKDLVLKSLVKSAYKEYSEDDQYEDFKIHREFYTTNNKRIDIVIETSSHVIGIEHKIKHSLNNDLSEYYNTVKQRCGDGKIPICIVLSLNELTNEFDKELMKMNNFVNVPYRKFISNLRQELGNNIYRDNVHSIHKLMDFVFTIENRLNNRVMENKELWTFFRKNAKTIEERLLKEFMDFKNNKLPQQVTNLKNEVNFDSLNILDVQERISEGTILVYEFTINEHQIAIDIQLNINGWFITLFGRNDETNEYIKNEIGNSEIFKGIDTETPDEEYGRLSIKEFPLDSELLPIAETLRDLLKRLDKYNKQLS